MTEKNIPLLIIGSGPAGCSAAIYCARAGFKPLMLSGMQPGGQLTTTGDVENYPGFADPVGGSFLTEQMIEQARRAGTTVEQDLIIECDFSTFPFELKSDAGILFRASSVIIATGAQARWLGIPGEAELKGRGVSSCAVCDGAFFRNQHVVVVGGGDSAAEEALYLSRIAQKVSLIHRRDKLRAEKILQDRIAEAENITPLWNKVVTEITGDEAGVAGVRLAHAQSGEALESLACTGVFIAIGHDPVSAPFKPYLNLDQEGYILAKPGTGQTNIEGVFVAGDVSDKIYRQAVTAAGMGCMAAFDAIAFLENREAKKKISTAGEKR